MSPGTSGDYFFICKSLVWETGYNPGTQEHQRPILDGKVFFVKCNAPTPKSRSVRVAQKEFELWKTNLLLTLFALRNS